MADEKSKTTEVNIDKQRLGAVYAKSLLNAAGQQLTPDELVGELDSLIDDVFSRFPDLERTLASPRIAGSEKDQLLDRIFGGRASDSLLTFLKIVGQHGRLDCLRQIRTAARDELNMAQGRIKVVVTTADPIAEAVRTRISDQLQQSTGAPIDLRCEVDSDVIGGLVVRVGDTVYDGSVANQLAQLKRETLGKTFNELRDAIDRFAVSG